MPSIPNDLTSAEQNARRDTLEVKQNRFFYATAPVYDNLDVPWLHEMSAVLIKSEEPEYWADSHWETSFNQRISDSQASVFSALPGWLPGFVNLTLENYPDLPAMLPAPNDLDFRPNFRVDPDFAAQRLAGCNPFAIERVASRSDLPPELAIDDGHIHSHIKIDAAIAEGRLYMCDYKALESMAEMAPDGMMNKFLYSPIALFYWEGDFSDNGKLIPLGIQLRKEGAGGTDIFMPPGSQQVTNPTNWLLAKAAVQSADAHALEWDAHLGRVHIALIPFSISSERHLHPEHPVLILLRPHLRILLAINNKHDLLIAPGSYGHLAFQPLHNDFMHLISKNYAAWDFDVHNNFREELSRRRMLDAPIPFPYRDDGAHILAAIEKFVSNYVNYYYRTNDRVADDHELQGFIRELLDPDFGRLKDHIEHPMVMEIDNRRKLITFLTSIIWTAGPLHAVVNYPQWGYMADPRNMPPCLYQEMPPSGDAPAPLYPAGFFPPLVRAHQQVGLGYVLGTYRYDKLGYYRLKDFTDPQAQDFVKEFQCDLAHAGYEIHLNNERRRRSYPYLYPWNITNSTSI